MFVRIYPCGAHTKRNAGEAELVFDLPNHGVILAERAGVSTCDSHASSGSGKLSGSIFKKTIKSYTVALELLSFVKMIDAD
jgi:hypothetical protein